MSNLTGKRTDQHIGNYQLKQLIGQGGFAEVYLGEHIYLKTLVAVKILHTQLTREDQESFLHEARTIAHLKHPNILPVLEFGVEDGTPFLVMDYASNGSLREHFPTHKNLTPIVALPYIKQVAFALQYAHQQNIIHRDVKPENILLGAQNEVLLSDFGIALGVQSSRTQSMQDVAGTVAYMAPELLQGKPCPASDQYSLGIVLYEWLSGNSPFHGTFTEIASQQVLAPPPAIKTPSVSPEVEAVIMQALAKAPQQRFESIQAFATAFEQASLDVGGTFRAQPGWRLPPDIYQQTQATPPLEEQPTTRESSPSTNVSSLPTRSKTFVTLPDTIQHSKRPSRVLAIVLGIVALLVATSGLVLALRLNASPSGPTAQEQATVHAQATLTAWQHEYEQATSGKPFLNDPSRNNGTLSKGCIFTEGAYHVSVNTPYATTLCSTDATDKLSNIAYQVQMTSIQGGEGGIFFRDQFTPIPGQIAKLQVYFFSLNSAGNYTLWTIANQHFKTLLHRNSSAIKTGLNQSNLLSIIAQGKQIALYINKQFVDSVTDASSDSGSTGLFVRSLPDSTDMIFTHVQIWRL